MSNRKLRFQLASLALATVATAPGLAQAEPRSLYSLPWQLRSVTIGSAARLDSTMAAFNDPSGNLEVTHVTGIPTPLPRAPTTIPLPDQELDSLTLAAGARPLPPRHERLAPSRPRAPARLRRPLLRDAPRHHRNHRRSTRHPGLFLTPQFTTKGQTP